MNDLPTVLDAFAAHIARHDVDHRPHVWAAHFDIWGDPQGEIGVPGITIAEERMAAFAVMVPFIMVPTIGTSWLVADCSDYEIRHVTVVKVSASGRGLDVASWRVPFSVTDQGTLVFSEPFGGRGVPDRIRDAVIEALRGRNERTCWHENFDYERALEVAREMLA
jgi:hypothetical protein